MVVGIVLLVLGGFLLGGAYSVWTSFGAPEAGRRRSGGQLAAAAVLLVAALLATVAGVLWLL